jgi:prepilin-type processing-associated H-X9-DG protein
VEGKGSSNVIMIAEKYLNPHDYNTGADPGDNECMYVGMDNDVYRSTINPPMMDKMNTQNTLIFGSAHQPGLNVLFCDGHVELVSYGVDAAVWRNWGSRY